MRSLFPRSASTGPGSPSTPPWLACSPDPATSAVVPRSRRGRSAASSAEHRDSHPRRQAPAQLSTDRQQTQTPQLTCLRNRIKATAPRARRRGPTPASSHPRGSCAPASRHRADPSSRDRRLSSAPRWVRLPRTARRARSAANRGHTPCTAEITSTRMARDAEGDGLLPVLDCEQVRVQQERGRCHHRSTLER